MKLLENINVNKDRRMMVMFKKIIKSVLNSGSSKYKRYSSSSRRRGYSRKHDYYGHKHYKKGYKKSFFSSRSYSSS